MPSIGGAVNVSLHQPFIQQFHIHIGQENSAILNKGKGNPLGNKMSNESEILPLRVVDGIEKFLIFEGNIRSGSSIIGSLLDAHPHVVIANHFTLFKRLTRLTRASVQSSWKAGLFQKLYSQSTIDSIEIRSNSSKGYSLHVEGLWQGRYADQIEVIGDKSNGNTTRAYLQNKETFKELYQKFKDEITIPVLVIHTIRNLFDTIATDAVIKHSGYDEFRKLKHSAIKSSKKFNRPDLLNREIVYTLAMFDAAQELTENVFGKGNVLDVHNCDLVDDPRGTMSRIFDFLEVDTTEHYLDVCAEKVFKSESRSRTW